MRMSQLLGLRFKETPAECQAASHSFMIRGGYIKNVGNGIFSLYTPAKLIVQKIENILREEMNRIGGQEVLFPVVMPAALWRESGRYDKIGSELARFKDRSGSGHLLGMTHEEAAVHLSRGAAPSYINYPFMIYQIQTKFRDEPRSRCGLIRVREFTMKDGYSFHTSKEDFEEYYEKCHKAYERIYERVGIPETISVKADSGMMGGKISHEFMLLTDIGEDTLVLCDECDYRSNMEVAECIVENAPDSEIALERVYTPEIKTIADLCDLLNIRPEKTCKAVVYQKNLTDEYVVVFLRGDLDVNETKLRIHLHEDIHPAIVIDENSGLTAGFIGALNLTSKVTAVFDNSLKDTRNMVCGANEEGYHYKGFSFIRDLSDDSLGQKVVFGDFAKAFDGTACPKCGAYSLKVRKGIEIGNIFQLGTFYTESMNMQYTDKDGSLQYPIMGCYGIGVGRLMASVCEVRRDDFGPIWPISIAPWQVHICTLNNNKEDVRLTAEHLYSELLNIGVETIIDDRPVSTGVMFSDADLLGVPLRVIISPKTCARGVAEIVSRDKSFRQEVMLAEAPEFIKNKITEMLEEFR